MKQLTSRVDCNATVKYYSNKIKKPIFYCATVCTRVKKNSSSIFYLPMKYRKYNMNDVLYEIYTVPYRMYIHIVQYYTYNFVAYYTILYCFNPLQTLRYLIVSYRIIS